MSHSLQAKPLEVLKFRNQKKIGWQPDYLAIEEPLELRIEYGPDDQRQGLSIAITMRTPGEDEKLALGFLFTEGVIEKIEQVLKVYGCGPRHPQNAAQNIVKVELHPDVTVDTGQLTRHVFTSSSCGICGKASLDAVRMVAKSISAETRPRIPSRLLEQLPELLVQQQATFQQTGGLHAAALFNETGQLIACFEDVGRHNALDKLIGFLVQNRLAPDKHLLLVSGRASFELVQKAALAGIPFLAAIGAPSSLAVELAEEMGMGLAGFVKPGRVNLYTGETCLSY